MSCWRDLLIMIIENNEPPNFRVIDETLLYPLYPSGLTENQSPIVRYRHSNLKEPVLKLVDYIYDYNGNYIPPGMYELALTDDKEFLLLIEAHSLIAVIPVFKLSQNEAAVQRIQQKRAEELEAQQSKKPKKRKVKYKEKLQSILRAKYALEAITPPDEDYIFMNAEIEYIEEGGYYLITYENGAYRAWGAIKTRNKFGGKAPARLKEREE